MQAAESVTVNIPERIANPLPPTTAGQASNRAYQGIPDPDSALSTANVLGSAADGVICQSDTSLDTPGIYLPFGKPYTSSE